MPLLGDLTTQINQNQGILNTYEEKTRREAWRSILDAITAYAVLKEPTRFDLGDAQIVSLDLDEVATRGGPAAERQSAVMNVLGRLIGASFEMFIAGTSQSKVIGLTGTISMKTTDSGNKLHIGQKVYRITAPSAFLPATPATRK